MQRHEQHANDAAAEQSMFVASLSVDDIAERASIDLADVAVRFDLNDRSRKVLEAFVSCGEFDGDVIICRRAADGRRLTERVLGEIAGVSKQTADRAIDDLQRCGIITGRHRRGCPKEYIVRVDVINRDAGPFDGSRQLRLQGGLTHELTQRALTGLTQSALTPDPLQSQGFWGECTHLPSEPLNLEKRNSEGCTPEVSKTAGKGSGLWGFDLQEHDLANGPRLLDFFEVALRNGDGCVEDSEQCRLQFLAFAHNKHRQWKRNRAKGRETSGVALFLHNLRQADAWGKEWDDHRPSKEDEDFARQHLQPRPAPTPTGTATALPAVRTLAASVRQPVLDQQLDSMTDAQVASLVKRLPREKLTPAVRFQLGSLRSSRDIITNEVVRRLLIDQLASERQTPERAQVSAVGVPL